MVTYWQSVQTLYCVIRPLGMQSQSCYIHHYTLYSQCSIKDIANRDVSEDISETDIGLSCIIGELL